MKKKDRIERIVISRLLLVSFVNEGMKRKIEQMNIWFRSWCRVKGYRFLDHWDLFCSSGDLYKMKRLHLKCRGTNILAGRFTSDKQGALN